MLGGDDERVIAQAMRLAQVGNVITATALLETLAQTHPGSPRVQVALADVLRQTGRYSEALRCYESALPLEPASDRKPEDGGARIGLALCLAQRPLLARQLTDRQSVADLLSDTRIDPALLAGAAAVLLRDSPDMLADPLLHLLLRRTPTTDLGLERALVQHRRRLCLSPPSEHGELAGALAIQGQLNEFVWSVSAEEESALPTAPTWVQDMYGPLAPDPDLSRRAAGVPALTMIHDAVSTAVAHQYEEHPYPRWTSLPPHATEDLDVHLARLTRGTWSPPEGVRRPRLLAAGCGTGREMLSAASAWRPSEVVGVDLSRTSLGYAHRMAEQLGIPVELFHGDLLALVDWDRRFDVIVCTGVLHHLDDPIAGWRVLTGLLSPGGVMLVGLYSATARQGVLAARDEVRRRGLLPTTAGIRAARELVSEMPKAQACLALSDFYYLSGCRDLLLHAHEQEFTIADVRAALEHLDLELLGFEVDGAERHRFGTLFGRGDDLASWEAYEGLFPRTFLGMYQFWCRASER